MKIINLNQFLQLSFRANTPKKQVMLMLEKKY